ncbi:P-II family nitrogen regulator [Pyrobaculum arsenaticum]|uniref:P-II family nitrogen regulator n=1 Tax=Pyrobaculum arsenaticum TaxID=121277 RepID=A0A7L4P5J8_9CREN|nr:P-II family nitrogen regulator [Pyrobaculum arsenaticum]
MVMVKAVIREDKLMNVLAALIANGFTGATAYRVQGMGGEGGVASIRGSVRPVLVPRVVVEVVINEEQTEKVIRIITETARTGEVGDGRIFVIPISAAIRIRTGELLSA